MLVKTNAPNVVPRSRLMADVALGNLHIFAARVARSVRLTGDFLVYHFKVHHIMARRGLMALGAILRARRRMLKRGNRPLRRRVARSAVLTEQSEMLVFCRVATRAVEFCFERRNERMIFWQKRIIRLIWNINAVGQYWLF